MISTTFQLSGTYLSLNDAPIKLVTFTIDFLGVVLVFFLSLNQIKIP